MSTMTRRKFLGLLSLTLPTAVAVDAACLEPTNLRVSKLVLPGDGKRRFVHFTDLHYKGDERYGSELVRAINDLAPEFVCFTGDLVEDIGFAPGALEFIRQIKAPVYGSPGNHDYWCGASFAEYEQAFAATGGGWLVDRALVVADGEIEIVGMAKRGIHALQAPQAPRRLLLLHYPEMADRLGGPRFDLIMAGHSHGGQVRLPWYGPLVLPWGVGLYDLGYFETKGGPLYVNAGIGTYHVPIRFNCRPEITLVTM
jgi:predicted MPP superfamily phosphohydrolase